MTPKKSLYDKLGPQVAAALERRRFSAQYCSCVEEARQAVLDRIGPEKLVSWGGSATVDALGVKEALKERGQPMLDRAQAKTPEESSKMMKAALTCDVYLLSTNALTADGQLVNLDGTGNRVAALIYGPDQVIVVAGMNKVTADLDTAVSRVRNLAAPMNAQRFQRGTPCCVTGRCADCTSPDSICASLVITRLCKPAGRVHVILVGEDLGM